MPEMDRLQQKTRKKCEFRIFFGFCFRSGSNLAEVDEVDAGDIRRSKMFDVRCKIFLFLPMSCER